jgi:hypothetical protein
MSRSLLFVAAASLFTMLAACSSSESAATSDSLVEAQEGELTNNLTLEQATLMLGKVEQGGSVTIAYEPSTHYLTGSKSKPFLGVELLPSTASGSSQDLSISVAGNFPGTPRVLVTDESFHVIAGSRNASPDVQQDGDHVTVTVPASSSRRFVLVRDGRWVEPMHFDIEAAPL